MNLAALQQAVASGPRLYQPDTQLQTWSRTLQSPLSSPLDLGSTLLQPQVNKPNLFPSAYTDRALAQRDLAQAQTQARDECTVFPPLLVRYQGSDDFFIPVKVFSGGELHRTSGIPDMVINFHAESHAITLTVCQVPTRHKYPLVRLAISTLYSMTSQKPLNLTRFLEVYDRHRSTVLHALSNYTQNPE